MRQPNLLPMPKKLRTARGQFALKGKPLKLFVAGNEALPAALSLVADIERRWGVAPVICEMHKDATAAGRKMFVLAAGDTAAGRPGRADAPAQQADLPRDARIAAVKRLIAPLAKAPEPVRDQAYILNVAADGVVAAAESARGLFYAAQTLRQWIGGDGRVPCGSVVDWPAYPQRGVMLDISRFKVPTMDTLFALVERLASLKVNVFQLYTEHTFRVERHAKISEGCDPITADEVRRLDQFCQQQFIDLQANLQSFGHQSHMLALPEYNDLAEVAERPYTLSPAVARTYRVLDEMYRECLPAYESDFFNAGCDETWDLGGGRSKWLADKMGVARVYLNHIRRINQLAHKYDKRMMIWGDIVLQHPELIPDIPKDILMLDWGYSRGADLSGEAKFAEAGLEHWTCPGVSTWSRIFAFFDNAAGNIAERAVQGIKTGATGLLNTDWGDGGHPQLASSSYRGYAWGAEQSWTPNVKADRGDFNRRFASAWFGDDAGLFGKLYEECEKIAAIPTGIDENKCRLFLAYWGEFPIPESSPDWATPAKLRAIAAQIKKATPLARQARKLHPEHAAAIDEILFGLRQIAFVLKKIELSRKIQKLKGKDRKKLPPPIKKAMRSLRAEWLDHKKEFERLWLLRNRPSEIAYRLSLYDERTPKLE